jgi:hypothetical protein
MLRRHDYTTDILNNLGSASYALDLKEFDGIVVPTKRKVFARSMRSSSLPEQPAVSIRVLDFRAS